VNKLLCDPDQVALHIPIPSGCLKVLVVRARRATMGCARRTRLPSPRRSFAIPPYVPLIAMLRIREANVNHCFCALGGTQRTDARG
jgi:hypothetical protein